MRRLGGGGVVGFAGEGGVGARAPRANLLRDVGRYGNQKSATELNLRAALASAPRPSGAPARPPTPPAPPPRRHATRPGASPRVSARDPSGSSPRPAPPARAARTAGR